MNKHHPHKEKLPGHLAHWLQRELGVWLGARILTKEQVGLIKESYVWPKGFFGVRRHVKFVSALQAIGAVLIGAGVLSLIAFNWVRLGNFTKLLIIVCALVGTHCVGFFVSMRRPHFVKTGASLIFLANLLYGGGIWLVAQMYHIQATFASGVFLWAVGVVPFAYVIRSRLNYYLTIALFIVWTFAESFALKVPHFAFLFVLLGLLLPLSYYLKERIGLTVCIITGGVWLFINTLFWCGDSFFVECFLPLALYGITLLSLSNLHRMYRLWTPYVEIYRYSGISIMGIVFFLMPFFGFLRYEPLAITHAYRYIPFWTCNYVLIVLALTAKFVAGRIVQDARSIVLDKMIPFLMAAALYILIMPQKKPSLLVNLVPLAAVAFMYWYYSRSRVLLNSVLIYCMLWLPFFLVDWKQMLLVFILELACGSFCYMLGSFYHVKYNVHAEAFLFKVLGLLIFFGSLYVISFGTVGRIFSRDFKFPLMLDFWLLFGIVYVGILLLYRILVPLKYSQHKHGLLPEEQYLVTFLPLSAPILFIVIASRPVDFWYTFGSNALYMGILVTFIAVGYRRNELHTKVLAFSFLVLLVLSRYLELEWSLLYKAILFISTGIFILVIGIFAERHKQEVVVIEK